MKLSPFAFGLPGVVAAFALVTGIVFVNREREQPPGTATAVVTASPEQLQWFQVNDLFRARGAEPGFIETWSRYQPETPNLPGLYVRGMALLADNRPGDALETFGEIPPQRIPPYLIYAPYRLHARLRPGEPNPYGDRMEESLLDPRVPELVRARVHFDRGDYRKALLSYRKSDPADWSSVDARAFEGMISHGGFAVPASRLAAAALRAKRPGEQVSARLIAAIRARSNPPQETAGDMDDKLRELLDAHPGVREAAEAGVRDQLELRRKFLERKYGEVVESQDDRPVASLASETVLLSFLSAARNEDPARMDRYAQELRRRFPGEDVKRWVNEIRNNANGD